MALSERLQYVLDFDTKGAVKSLENVGKAADKELGKADQKLDKLGTNLTKFGAGALAVAGVAGAALGKMAQGAADTDAAFSALNQVVGEVSAQNFAEWAEDGAEKVGLARGAIYDAAATFGMFGKEAGLAGVELDRFIEQQIVMAADFAAFKNVEPEQVINDIRAAYAGSSETLQKYVGTVNDAAIKQAYFEETGQKVTGTLSGQERVLGINALLLEKGADMAGQFARESGELSGQQAIAKANLKNLSDEIGAGALPMLIQLMEVANKAIGAFAGLNDATGGNLGQWAAYGVAGLAAVGALSSIVGQIIRMRAAFVALRGVMAAHPLLTIGTVLAGAAVAFGLFGGGADEASEKVDELAAKLRETNDELATFTDHAVQLATDNDDLRASMVAAGLSTDDLTAAITGSKDEAEAFTRALLDGAEAAGVSETGQLNLAATVESNRQITEDAIQTAEELAAVTSEQARATVAHTEAIGRASQAEKDYVKFLEGRGVAGREAMAAAAEEQKRAEEELESAIQATMNAQRAATDAVFAARQASQRFAEQTWNTAAAMGDATLSAEQKQIALDDLTLSAAAVADAEVRIAEETAAAAGETYGAEQRTRDFSASLLEQADQLDGPQRQAILDYVASVNGIPTGRATSIQALIDELSLTEVEAQLTNLARSRIAAVQVRLAGGTMTPDGGIAFGGGQIARKSGGPIPGPKDAPVPILAHGGEFVLSADVVDAVKRGGPTLGLGSRPQSSVAVQSGGGLTVNIENATFNDQGDVEAFAAVLNSKLRFA